MAITRAFLNSQRYDEAKGGINNTYTSPIIINGDMGVTQRGDQTGVTAEKYTTADRFVINISSLGTWSFSSSTDTPGFGFGKTVEHNYQMLKDQKHLHLNFLFSPVLLFP